MDYISQGFVEAFKLLLQFDPEVYEIIFLSIFVSSSATILAALIFVPLGVYLGIKPFRGKRMFSRLVYTFMSIPSVVVGLLVALILARRGPLGFLGLLYTPKAMIIAQTFLVVPLILGLTYNMAKSRGKQIEVVAKTLGGTRWDSVVLIIRELRSDIFIHIVTGFSRAISEVGAVMIVGGNIKYQTRVITTTISMMNSMGDYPMAIALGTILMIISFVIHSLIYSYSRED